MSNKKQSSVEWLVEQMFKQGFFDGNKPFSLTTLEQLQQQAKAMHKQEILDTYWNGVQPPPNDSEKYERYYNETFGGGE